jgi:hypothetical protein
MTFFGGPSCFAPTISIFICPFTSNKKKGDVCNQQDLKLFQTEIVRRISICQDLHFKKVFCKLGHEGTPLSFSVGGDTGLPLRNFIILQNFSNHKSEIKIPCYIKTFF